MPGYDEIGAMEFSKGFLLVQGNVDTLRKMLVEEYTLDEATANWHIEQAQQWATQTRKELNWKDGECGGWYKLQELNRESEGKPVKTEIVQNGKIVITKENLKYLLILLDEAENLSYEACKSDCPGMEINKSLGCAIWMRAYEVGFIESVLKIMYKNYSITDEMIESMVDELRNIRAENPSILDYL